MSETATPPVVAGSGPAPTFLKRISKCRSDEKNQDWADVQETDSGWFATVCDGATQSMRSAEAALIVGSDPADLWVEGGLRARVVRLERRREELLATEPAEPVDDTSYLSRTFAQIARDQQQHAFQTTFVSARITPLPQGRKLEVKICGDSAFFVFDQHGRLLTSSPKLDDEFSPFDHSSPFTEVLPDHFRDEEPSFTEEIADDAHVILCSDGFYDSFLNAAALFHWLSLNSDGSEPALEELHAQLDQRRGDDDISFVWLFPRAIPTSAPEPLPAISPVIPHKRPLAALAILLRRCADWLTRVALSVAMGTTS